MNESFGKAYKFAYVHRLIQALIERQNCHPFSPKHSQSCLFMAKTCSILLLLTQNSFPSLKMLMVCKHSHIFQQHIFQQQHIFLVLISLREQLPSEGSLESNYRMMEHRMQQCEKVQKNERDRERWKKREFNVIEWPTKVEISSLLTQRKYDEGMQR